MWRRYHLAARPKLNGSVQAGSGGHEDGRDPRAREPRRSSSATRRRSRPATQPDRRARIRQAAPACGRGAGADGAGGRRLVLVDGRPLHREHRRRLCAERHRGDQPAGRGLRARGPGRRQPGGPGGRRARDDRRSRLQGAGRRRRGRPRRQGGRGPEHGRPDHAAAVADRPGGGRGAARRGRSDARPPESRALPAPRPGRLRERAALRDRDRRPQEGRGGPRREPGGARVRPQPAAPCSRRS